MIDSWLNIVRKSLTTSMTEAKSSLLLRNRVFDSNHDRNRSHGAAARRGGALMESADQSKVRVSFSFHFARVNDDTPFGASLHLTFSSHRSYP